MKKVPWIFDFFQHFSNLSDKIFPQADYAQPYRLPDGRQVKIIHTNIQQLHGLHSETEIRSFLPVSESDERQSRYLHYQVPPL